MMNRDKINVLNKKSRKIKIIVECDFCDPILFQYKVGNLFAKQKYHRWP